MRHANTLLQQAADFLGSINSDSSLQDEMRQRQQQRYRALRVLHRLQRYRHGVGRYTDIGYTNTEIGRAIDFAIRELRSHFQPEKTSVPSGSPAGMSATSPASFSPASPAAVPAASPAG